MVRFDIYCIVAVAFIAVGFIAQWVFINCLKKYIKDLLYEFRRVIDNSNNCTLQMHSQLVSITNNMIYLFGRILETDDEIDDE